LSGIIFNEIRYNSKNQPYKVIGKGEKQSDSHYRMVCEFIDTGTVKDYIYSSVRRNTVRDPYAKDVLGVASTGDIVTEKNKSTHSVWSAMINRCYNPRRRDYKNYGGKGVTVSERWLCFENFVEDVPFVEGFDKKKFTNFELVLDKDIKQKELDHSERVYSLETCTFVSRKENNIHRKYNTVKAIAHKNGEHIYIDNVPSFSREYDVGHGTIYKCINGKYRQAKGYTFTLPI